jgi:hypothetical protein
MTLCRRFCCLPFLLGVASGCERQTPSRTLAAASASAAASSPSSLLLPEPPVSLAAEGEARRAARVEPVEYVSQRLAFTRQRFAYLRGSEVVVYQQSDFAEVARFTVEDGSNLVGVLGDDFLALGRERIQRLSAHEQRAERLPRAPRLGLTTIWPSPRESSEFWLEYEGVPSLAQFDLEQATEGVLLPRSFITLPDFDRRALVVLSDTSVVYSTVDGLRRVLAEQPVEPLLVPELEGPIWRLLAADTPDRLWALTRFAAVLVALRPRPMVLERVELVANTVAAVAQGSRLALLAYEGDPFDRQLRVDVREIGRREAWTLRWRDVAERVGGEARPWPPELALAPRAPLVALGANQVSVHDFERGVPVLDASRRR